VDGNLCVVAISLPMDSSGAFRLPGRSLGLPFFVLRFFFPSSFSEGGSFARLPFCSSGGFATFRRSPPFYLFPPAAFSFLLTFLFLNFDYERSGGVIEFFEGGAFYSLERTRLTPCSLSFFARLLPPGECFGFKGFVTLFLSFVFLARGQRLSLPGCVFTDCR